jgi:hypothetical protein
MIHGLEAHQAPAFILPCCVQGSFSVTRAPRTASRRASSVMSFRGGRLADLRLPAGTAWLLTGIAEAKGRRRSRPAPQGQRGQYLEERATEGVASQPGAQVSATGVGAGGRIRSWSNRASCQTGG